MFRVAAGEVDRAYLERWIGELDLEDQWRAAQALLVRE